MFKLLIKTFKFDLSSKLYENYIIEILKTKNSFHSFLLTETNIWYKFPVPSPIFDFFPYICPYEQEEENYKIIHINRPNDGSNIPCYDLRQYIQQKERIFYRYEKFFLVMKMSTKPIKNQKESTLKEIIKYI